MFGFIKNIVHSTFREITLDQSVYKFECINFKVDFIGTYICVSNDLTTEYIITHIIGDITDKIGKNYHLKIKVVAFVIYINSGATPSIYRDRKIKDVCIEW